MRDSHQDGRARAVHIGELHTGAFAALFRSHSFTPPMPSSAQAEAALRSRWLHVCGQRKRGWTSSAPQGPLPTPIYKEKIKI